MAYTLLYSRNITSDDRARFTDVPIESSSIMIDILSLRSPYYRIAGYAYSIVSDGLIDYERGTGYTLPFGKNRLLFPNTALPYYLEFFPKWGTKQAIVSVYTGSPSPPLASVPIPGTSERVYIDGASQTVFLSRGPGQPFEDLGWGFIYRAWVGADGRIYTDSYQPSKGIGQGPDWVLDRLPDYNTYVGTIGNPSSTPLPVN